jgi:hypothetical protein
MAVSLKARIAGKHRFCRHAWQIMSMTIISEGAGSASRFVIVNAAGSSSVTRYLTAVPASFPFSGTLTAVATSSLANILSTSQPGSAQQRSISAAKDWNNRFVEDFPITPPSNGESFMRSIAFAFAILLAFMMLAPAGAAPVKTSVTLEPLTIQTQARRRDRDRRQDMRRRDRRRDARRHYRAGRRYNRAPRGWHRYRSRPGHWRSRGCIIVGPVWFCP